METSLTTTLDYGPFRVGGAVVRPRFHFTHDSPEAPRVCGQVVCGGRPGLSPALTPSHSGVSPGPPPSQARGHVPGDWAPGGSRHDSPFLKGATTRKRPRMQVTPPARGDALKVEASLLFRDGGQRGPRTAPRTACTALHVRPARRPRHDDKEAIPGASHFTRHCQVPPAQLQPPAPSLTRAQNLSLQQAVRTPTSRACAVLLAGRRTENPHVLPSLRPSGPRDAVRSTLSLRNRLRPQSFHLGGSPLLPVPREKARITSHRHQQVGRCAQHLHMEEGPRGLGAWFSPP